MMDYKKQFDKGPTLIGDIIKNQWLVNFKQRANRKEVLRASSTQRIGRKRDRPIFGVP